MHQAGLRLLKVTLCATVVSLLSACGYSHQALFPEGIRTVAVPIFENRTTHYRGLERDVTEALIKEIEARR